MDNVNPLVDESALFQRIDRTSADALMNSVLSELVRLNGAQAELRARIAVMESLQSAADRIVAGDQEASSVRYPRQIVIDAADSFQGALGFYGLEYDSQGKPYRWSGPSRQFSLQFFVDRRAPAQFALRFGKLFADAPVEALTCFVDGQKVELMVKRAPSGHEATGVMPVRIDNGGSVLTFVCPAIQSPSSQGSDDSRMLGLLFRRLTVDTKTVETTGNADGAANEQEPSEPAPPTPSESCPLESLASAELTGSANAQQGQ